MSTPASRLAGRRTPGPHEELTHVDLGALRAYRRELAEEEGRVSYWRRILQARLDVLLAEAGQAPARRTAGIGGVAESLHAVLGQARSASRRDALLRLVPSPDVPALPDLDRLWHEGDTGERAALVGRLAAAEAELSAYRAALHVRLDRATAELIGRYHADPQSCLVALPRRG